MRYGRGRHDRSVEALRHQIRRAGADTRLCRTFLVTLFGGGMLVAAALALVAGSGPPASLLAGLFLLVAALLVVAVALPAARVYGRHERIRLARSLRSVPDELLAEAAVPLRRDGTP